MTPRQQRRLEQKLARKTAKKQRGLSPTLVEAFTSNSTPESCIAACASEVDGAALVPEVSLAETSAAQETPASAELEASTELEPRTTPISERKLLANRANSRLSTGARSESGKQIVSQNSTRHGLTGKFHVLAGESQADFDQLLATFTRNEQPADDDELEFVKRMVEALWLADRAIRKQDECLIAIDSGTPEEQKQAKKDLTLYLRYMTTHDRNFYRYSGEMRKRRNERARIERGFASQKRHDAQEARREADQTRKEADQTRKKELHELRQATQVLRQERVQINNRLAAAKAERFELQNQEAKSAESAPKTLAAAA